jgi:hypothetical protein
LIQVYRGLGGGWQIKCDQVPDKRGVLSPPPGEVDSNAPANSSPDADAAAPETLPAPANPATAPVPLPPQATPPDTTMPPASGPPASTNGGARPSPDSTMRAGETPAAEQGKPPARVPGPDLLPPPEPPQQ